jgi:hypothetical protein
MRLDELHPTIYVRHAVDGRRDVEVVHDARLRGNVRISQIPATYVWTPPDTFDRNPNITTATRP